MSTEPTSLAAKKEALSRETEMYKQAIDEQVHAIKENAGQLTKKALVIGAGLAITYFIVRSFTKKDTKQKKMQNKSKTRMLLPPKSYSNQKEIPFQAAYSETESKSHIGDLIKQQIAIFLIGIATQKLQEYLNGSRKNDPEPIRTDDTQYTETIYIS